MHSLVRSLTVALREPEFRYHRVMENKNFEFDKNVENTIYNPPFLGSQGKRGVRSLLKKKAYVS